MTVPIPRTRLSRAIDFAILLRMQKMSQEPIHDFCLKSAPDPFTQLAVFTQLTPLLSLPGLNLRIFRGEKDCPCGE
jgi:hypothetical protein